MSRISLSLVIAFALAPLHLAKAQRSPLNPLVDQDAPARISYGIIRTATMADEGHELPLLASWNNGEIDPEWKLRNSWHPAWQMEMIRAGHFILPTAKLPAPWRGTASWKAQQTYLAKLLEFCALRRLPLCFKTTQWERVFGEPEFLNLSPEWNPNLIKPGGKIANMADPFGPIEAWRGVGQMWGAHRVLAKAAELYPNPPAVWFVTNNEHPQPRWNEVWNLSQRYRDRYSNKKPSEKQRRADLADAWAERYGVLVDGFRQSLPDSWRDQAKFILYDGFRGHGLDLGRWAGWPYQSFASEEQFAWQPKAVDGVSLRYYIDNGGTEDDQVWSPQIGSFNWPMMIAADRAMNPDFIFEMSVWDGQPKRAERYDAERYVGTVLFGAWVARPAVVREFRYATDTLRPHEYEQNHPRSLGYGEHTRQLAAALKRIHNNPRIRDFWQHGRLVANPDGWMPYDRNLRNLPQSMRDAPRWFLLDCDLNPTAAELKRDGQRMQATITVFAIAVEHEGRHLIYAHAPNGPTECTVTIPDVGDVTLDATKAGVYRIVDSPATDSAGQN